MWFDRRSMWLAILAAACIVAAPAAQQPPPAEKPPIPENASALEGVPDVRIEASREGAERRKLTAAEADRERLKITVSNGRYYWSSRENLPLTAIAVGEFTYLASPRPGRYIRLRRISDRIEYVEHLDMPVGSVTYWGELRIILRK